MTPSFDLKISLNISGPLIGFTTMWSFFDLLAISDMFANRVAVCSFESNLAMKSSSVVISPGFGLNAKFVTLSLAAVCCIM